MRKLVQQQYETERYYHNKLINETSFLKRQVLYTEAYTQVSKIAEKRRAQRGNKDSAAGFNPRLGKYLTPLFKEKDILDVGCGRGWFPLYLSKFARSVVGIDVSQEALQIARRIAKDRKMRWTPKFGPGIKLISHL